MMGRRGSRGFVGTVAAVALFTAALLAPGPAVAFEPVASFGSDGEGAGQVSAPGGIAVGPEGNFFVADQGNHRVGVFSSGGEFLYAFGKGVRLGGGDVCDSGSGCRAGEGGGSAGAFAAPQGLAISKAGTVYIADEGNDRVSVFSTSGVFEFAFGNRVTPAGGSICTSETGCQAGSNFGPPPGPGEAGPKAPAGALGKPEGIAIDESGEVFVTESENNRISLFDPLGGFLEAIGLEVDSKNFENFCTENCWEGNPFPGGGIFKPAGIATLPDGSFVVSDAGNHRLVAYSPEGEFLAALGHEVGPAPGEDVCTVPFECGKGEGEGPGSLATPAGLAVSPTGAITVGDVGLQRVSQFDASGIFVRALGAGVRDGAEAFQVCTALTGCRAGVQGSIPGATSHPFGVAEACGGSIFVSESTSGLSRVERFGEPGSAAAVCPPPSKQPPSAVTVRVAPTNIFQLGRLKRDRKHGTATLFVSVPDSGELELGGRGIHPTSRSPAADTTVKLPIRLVGKFRRNLLSAGHRRVNAAITFIPEGGNARTELRKLTLVKLKPKPRRHH